MDNETSKEVDNFIVEQQAKFHYTLAGIHHTKISKKGLTWKNNFTAIRAGAPPFFRMENWCKMTEQCDINLNMMRLCTLNPRLSALEATEGMYSFDATTMAPVGTETMIHVLPSDQSGTIHSI